ncbi:MAG: asparagine synthetase B, partial [Proteobacteria bacterium]|nr:asparagine synthetase B [Pseudomonadota bacterium]
SDAETALWAWVTWGPDALDRFNGDFGLAVIEEESGRIFLARDRLGVRRLFYLVARGSILFASRIGCLWGHPLADPEVDWRAVYLYAGTHYRYFHSRPERTFFEHVRQVPQGGALEFTPGEDSPRIRRWWTLGLLEDDLPQSADEAALGLRSLLADAVSLRLGDGKDLGFTLSSGMDSSSVCALATGLLGKRQPVFSITYREQEFDEEAGIRPAALAFADPWHNLPLADPPLLDVIDRMLTFHDEPLCTVTWLSHYYLLRRAREVGVKILFSGLGGDECNAGEYEYFLFFFGDLQRAGRVDLLDQEIAAWARLHDSAQYPKNKQVARDAFTRLMDPTIGRNLIDLDRYSLYLPCLDQELLKSQDHVPQMANPFDSHLINRCYQDLFFETTPPCLAADGRNAAAFGIESRFPFLDHRVVQYCLSIPVHFKYHQAVTKWPLRRAMADLLPRENLEQTLKVGWNAPAADWLRFGSAQDLRDLTASAAFRRRGVYRPDQVDKLVTEHLEGRANHMMFLWQLINLELWFRRLAEL